MPLIYGTVESVRRTFSDLLETSATFLAWTNSGPAGWSTPFVTVALTLICSVAPASSACVCRCLAAAKPSGIPTVRPDLEAQVMRDGMLVGYVPQIEGSEVFDESQIVDAIARTDYDQPVARQRTVAPPPGPALTREGGVFRRFLDGFRYR